MSDPNTTMDKLPVAVVRLIGEIHDKVNAINTKADTALGNQREMKREMGCMVKTWEEFHGTYGAFLSEELRRSQERAKLRTAVIEKGVILALCAVAGFMAMAIWEKVAHALQQVIAR